MLRTTSLSLNFKVIRADLAFNQKTQTPQISLTLWKLNTDCNVKIEWIKVKKGRDISKCHILVIQPLDFLQRKSSAKKFLMENYGLKKVIIDVLSSYMRK